MLVGINGTRNGIDWPQRGETIELPDAEAVDLINAGIAAPVADAPVEAAAIEPAESAVAPKARKR